VAAKRSAYPRERRRDFGYDWYGGSSALSWGRERKRKKKGEVKNTVPRVGRVQQNKNMSFVNYAVIKKGGKERGGRVRAWQQTAQRAHTAEVLKGEGHGLHL